MQAFSWQGEARVAHFLSWYVAPGIGREQCWYSKKVALIADFWNWRQQLRNYWRQEMDPSSDYDLIYVQPAPTDMEAGITGHVILQQHSQVDWAAVLISVYDPAVNNGHQFKMVNTVFRPSFPDEIFALAGCAQDCNQIAACSARLRGHVLDPNNASVRPSPSSKAKIPMFCKEVPFIRNASVMERVAFSMSPWESGK